MNYFLKFTSKPLYPIVFDSKQNPINGSYLAIGKYIKEEIKDPLKYNDAQNSNVEFEKLLTYDVINSVGGGCLLSLKAMEIIQSNFPDEVQFFKSIFNYKGKVCDSYHVINIYNKIECYDLEKSIFVKHPVDGSFKFSKIVLKSETLEEYGVTYNIVRNSYDNQIIVSEHFVKVIKSNKINSIIFK
jgi:hypothetical protein